MYHHHAQKTAAFVGTHLLYIYENGWTYELYVKHENCIDYRVHSGTIGGRWAKDQTVNIAFLAEGLFKVAWEEPTGTIVCLVFNLNDGVTHGTAFFPHWIADTPEETICFQNQYLKRTRDLRDRGPMYPLIPLHEYSQINAIQDCGEGNEDVISCAPDELPAHYIEQLCQHAPFQRHEA